MLLVAGRERRASVAPVRELAGLRPGDLPLAPLCDDDQLRLDVPSSAVARRGLALVQRASAYDRA
jgi:hypothetical protein